MSILRVTENWKAWEGNVGVNEQTLRSSGTFRRGFDVEFSEDDRSYRPIAALYCKDVPKEFDTLPGYPWIYVISREPRVDAESPLIVHVMVTYKIFEDPLAIPPFIRWDFSTESDEMTHAIKMRDNPTDPVTIVPVVNSAGESPQTAMMKEYNVQVLLVTVNRATYDPDQADLYMGAVNSDTFFGFPWGKVKCKKIKGEPQRAGAMEYWRHDYEFHIRTSGSDPLNVGWRRRYLDEGFREKVLVVKPGFPNKYELQDIGSWLVEKDDSGVETKRTFKPVSRPAMLDGLGRLKPESKPTVFMGVEDFNLLPFNVFGLG